MGKLFGFTGLVFFTGVGLVSLLTYDHASDHLATVLSRTQGSPGTPDLVGYSRVVPTISRIYAGDGTLLGEFAREWREVTPYDQIPEPLIRAVLAVEDHDFFDHGGIYFKGILRAAWTNFTTGDFVQGGSTITQQVAKQFIGNEKSLMRKAIEAILARRLERRYSKKAILSLYLNHIFLGNGAYGVKAAARRYFDKELGELTLAENALIAGLAQAPSSYSPTVHPELALERRNTVLDQMVKYGYIDAAAADAARAEPLRLKTFREIFPDRMPYFAEHVRRYVTDTYGADALLAGGLRVETAVDPIVDGAAAENADFGARKQDKRQGWRGPEWFVDGAARDKFLERSRTLYGAGPLEPERRYLALVDKVDGNGAEVLIGLGRYRLPLANMRWAAPWSASDANNDRTVGSAARVVRPGDVVWTSRELHTLGTYRDWHIPDLHNPRWQVHRDEPEWDASHTDVVQLEQVPHPQTAIFTADHRSGYVLGMAGGADHARSQFNRAVQACRQPGSTYKPIYYSAALDEGYGFDTVLNDIPRAEVDPITGEVWTPTNLHGTVDNHVSLEYALVFSKNVPSVAIFKDVGAKNVEQWARRLSFTTTIIADQALALGASCTRLDELTRAFAIFAREGQFVDWVTVRRIFDRDGQILEDHTVSYDPMLSPADRLDRLAATAGETPVQAISARTAHLTTKLLAQVVKYGFTTVLRQTGLNAAGKTGTSSATMDTSFVAFTSRWITSVWIGDDLRQRPLGKNDAAYMTAVPLWARYMNEVTQGQPNPEIPWHTPPEVSERDRGDHSKGHRGGQMSLIYRHADKPPADGALPPPGT